MERSEARKVLTKQLADAPPPSLEEERELTRRVREGDEVAEAELIRRNLRLVYDLARRYQTPGATFEDLVQEGAIGLLRAARKFEPARGNRFSTFAHWWIRQGISRFVKGPTRTIRLPEYLQDRLARVLKTRRELSDGRTQMASPEEVAERVGMDPKKTRRLIDLSQDTLSLETPVRSHESLTLGASLEDPEKAPPELESERRSQKRGLVEGLSHLPARQTQILAYRYGLADGVARSRPWIGKHLGLSSERIRQLENRALRSLRTHLERIS